MGIWATLWPARESLAAVRRGLVRVVEDEPYGSDHPKQALDLFLPPLIETSETSETSEPSQPGYPLAVFVHGGAWKPLDRKTARPWLGLYSNIGVALARGGVAAAIVGYRQHPLTDGDGSCADLRAAIAHLARTGPSRGIDTTQMVLIGHSAGGHLVLTLATRSTHAKTDAADAIDDLPIPIRGVITMGGFYDLPRALSSLGSREQRFITAIFGPGERAAERWSPERHIASSTPPLLAILAANETPWLRAEHEALLAAAVRIGAPIESLTIPDTGHMSMIIRIGTSRDASTAQMIEFIRRVTRPASRWDLPVVGHAGAEPSRNIASAPADNSLSMGDVDGEGP